jgi:hypothetical protein
VALGHDRRLERISRAEGAEVRVITPR